MAEAPAAEHVDAADTARIAGAYFDALARRDLDAAVAMWAPGGRVRAQLEQATDST